MANNLAPQQFPLMPNAAKQMEASPNAEIQVTMATQLGSFQLPQTNRMGPQLLPSRMHLQPTMVYNFGPVQLPTTNKRAPPLEPSPKSQVQANMVNYLGSQQLSMTNKRTAQMEPSPKAHTTAVESVRSKLRESLAAALSLVTQSQDANPGSGKDLQSEVATIPLEAHANAEPLNDSSSSMVMPVESKSDSKDISTESAQIHNEGQTLLKRDSGNELPRMWTSGEDLQPKHIFPDEDASYIIKDDLLQGNGLCWASDVDLGSFDTIAERGAKRPKLDVEEPQFESGSPPQCPQLLASKIEAELFKLFGGVNKKYKEKGRSLLFNLKDRNNPELRERVMSGEIPPEKLCTMTAEDLASKELSEWRIAKAEEMAQMVVLPDAEIDIRRLVRKTHKGEIQVEIERDDSVSVEVAIGESSLTQIPSRNSESEMKKPTKIKGSEAPEKIDSGRDNLITVTHDNADPMQGLTVEDELKDADFLPPIVSLDEFMDSLNAEPPFENSPGKAARDASTSAVEQKGDTLGLKSGSSVENVPSQEKSGKEDRTHRILKYTDLSEESEVADIDSKNDHVWNGLLQLNISSVVTVMSIFKSGEKTSTKDWPSLLEIKGRVRLDAFGKFLQELPLSRSRAIMVVQFCWKEGSPEGERSNLSEAVESYISDERVGLAEPAPGVELYFCPPYEKTVDLLSELLTKDHAEALKTIDSGLIGIVVWRRALVNSASSPKSSSRYKQNSRKPHSSSVKTQRQEKDASYRPSLSSHPAPASNNPNAPSDGNDDDDVPPGFGPPVTCDEEDLPEFQFSKGSQFPPGSSRMPSMNAVPLQTRQLPRPVEQVRELIHKYGQSTARNVEKPAASNQGVRIETQPWNDDDDIPEWQPHQDGKAFPPVLRTPVPNYRQQAIVSNLMPSQHPQHMQVPLQVLLQPGPPMATRPGTQNVPLGWQQGQWWPQHQQYGSNGGALSQFGGPNVGGQFSGMPGPDWRPRYP